MAVLENLPPSLRDALSVPPEPGSRNVWLFTVAIRARHTASPTKIRHFLQTVAARWPDRDFAPEIDRAITRAFSPSLPPGSSPVLAASAPPPWPPFNAAAWSRRITFPPKFDLTPIPITAEQAIDALFPPSTCDRGLSTAGATGPLLCCALDPRSAHTQPRENWRGKEAGLQFIVANPMTAPTGVNRSGHPSPRCHDNATRARRYQVVEFDRGTLEEQSAILSSLDSALAPLVLVVWSGGKSLHGWFQVGALSAYGQLRFFRHAVHLGADATLWDPAKLVRLPGGRRSTGETQHILYTAF